MGLPALHQEQSRKHLAHFRGGRLERKLADVAVQAPQPLAHVPQQLLGAQRPLCARARALLPSLRPCCDPAARLAARSDAAGLARARGC